MYIKIWIKNVSLYKMKARINGGVDMAMLPKNKPNMFAIKQEKAKDFILESNKHKISDSFIRECKEVSNIFKKN